MGSNACGLISLGRPRRPCLGHDLLLHGKKKLWSAAALCKGHQKRSFACFGQCFRALNASCIPSLSRLPLDLMPECSSGAGHGDTPVSPSWQGWALCRFWGWWVPGQGQLHWALRPLLLCQHKGRPGCCREVSTVKLYGGEYLTFLSFNLFLEVINIYEEPVSHL